MESSSPLKRWLHERPPFMPSAVDVMTATVELPPGYPGNAPHRHSGPVFGDTLEGEMPFERAGSAERVLTAGDEFWEPGGDLNHHQAANDRSDGWRRFVGIMVGEPGRSMLELVGEGELTAGSGRRVPRRAVPAERA